MTGINGPSPYVGTWVTGDGNIRHKLLPNGRYDEARGTRESAYLGRYEVTGNHIEYWDDTGSTADGQFIVAFFTMPEWFYIATDRLSVLPYPAPGDLEK